MKKLALPFLWLCSLSLHGADLGNMIVMRDLVEQYKELKAARNKHQETTAQPSLEQKASLESILPHITQEYSVLEHGEQKMRNATIMTALKEHLKTAANAALPEPLQSLIAEYVQPGWQHINTIKGSGGIVSRVWLFDDRVEMYTEDTKDLPARCELRDIYTGAIKDPVLPLDRIRRIRPHYLENLVEHHSFFDFNQSPDDSKRVASSIVEGLIVWNGKTNLRDAQLRSSYKQIPLESVSDQRPVLNSFLSVRFSPCSNYLVASKVDGSVTIMNATNGKKSYTLSHPESVTSVAVSSDLHRTLLAAGLANGDVCIWQGTFDDPSLLSLADLSELPALEATISGPDRMTMIDAPPASARHKCCASCCECGTLCAACCVLMYRCLTTGASCCYYCPCCCYETCQACRQEFC
jgi:hypothetical protein